MSDGVPQNTHGQGLTFTGQNVVMAIQCLEPTLVWGTPLFWGSGYQTIQEVRRVGFRMATRSSAYRL